MSISTRLARAAAQRSPKGHVAISTRAHGHTGTRAHSQGTYCRPESCTQTHGHTGTRAHDTGTWAHGHTVRALTAGLRAAVHRVHPQVGGAGVEENRDGLWRSANADHTVIESLKHRGREPTLGQMTQQRDQRYSVSRDIRYINLNQRYTVY